MICVLRLALLAFVFSSASAFGKNNDYAKAVAKDLLKYKPVEKANQGDLNKLRGQLVKLISRMEESYRTSKPNPVSLLEKAHEFRDDIGPSEQLVSSTVILEAWKEARQLGAFSEEGRYIDHITKGPSSGKKPIFEYVVPPSHDPKYSAYLGNIRLVPPHRARKGEEPTHADLAYLNRLLSVEREYQGMQKHKKFDEKGDSLNQFGRTEEEEKALFDAAVEEAGDAFHQKPGVRVLAKMGSTPAKHNDFTWRLDVEVTNLSRHPTEITVDSTMFGITWKERYYYKMKNDKRTFQLRRGQQEKFSITTNSEKSYKNAADDLDQLDKNERKRSRVIYRGFAVKVEHKTGKVNQTASDRHFDGYNDNGDLPNLHSLGGSK